MPRLSRRARRRDHDQPAPPDVQPEPEEQLAIPEGYIDPDPELEESGSGAAPYDSYGGAVETVEAFETYEETPIEPFVPVAADAPDEAYDESEDAAGDAILPARRRRLPHLAIRLPALGVEMRVVPLLLALALIVAGVFGTLLNLDEFDADVEAWWPAAVIGVAVLWMLVALIRRQVASFLGGSALAGIGISLLLSTQAVATLRESLVGLSLVTIGLGIVIRGFLLRQQVPLQRP
jgi:hypothetical protein